MKKLLLLSIFTTVTWAENPHEHMHHSHEGHLHEQLVDGKKLEVDPVRFDKFVMGLENSQIAVVNVQGMVCDFCARGIEKTFYNDNDVKKVKVSLEQGKVLIAYSLNKKVDLDEIKNIFLSNGQTATDIIIKNI